MKTASKHSLLSFLFLLFLLLSLQTSYCPHNPLEIFDARQAPGNGFHFWYDDKGRDIFSRMLYGGQIYSSLVLHGTAVARFDSTVAVL